MINPIGSEKNSREGDVEGHERRLNPAAHEDNRNDGEQEQDLDPIPHVAPASCGHALTLTSHESTTSEIFLVFHEALDRAAHSHRVDAGIFIVGHRDQVHRSLVPARRVGVDGQLAHAVEPLGELEGS